MRRLRISLLLAAAILVSVSLKPAASADFVLCSCQLCSHSDVICRISPSGYSTPCADYYASHCQP